MSAQKSQVEVEGRLLQLSNLDKVLYPEPGFTKAEVIDYYTRIAPYLLPHLHNRPLTLKRYPDGVEGEYFYEKNCPSHRPEWVQTKAVYIEQREREIDYCLVNDLPTLVWLANLADLELHTSLSLASDLDRPTVVAFDLDPGAPATIVQCAEVALLLKELFDQLKLESFAKTSGSKGMQVYLPLNSATTYEQTKPFAHALARLIERSHPDLVVSKMAKKLRKGKVFVDWSQNDEHKTTICVYSLRAMQTPTVSTPITWEEVERCAASKDADPLAFDSQAVLKRVADHGDLFSGVLQLSQELPELSSD